MAIEAFKLPDVGEGVAEGELVRWLVAEGDAVTEDQPVAEVETDKALVEIPSPYDGTVHELRAEEGEVVPVGTVVITFDVPDEAGAESVDAAETAETAEPEPGPEPPDEGESDAADEGDGRPQRTFAPPSVRRLARELDVDLSTVAGSGPSGRVTEGDVRAAVETETAEAEDENAAETAEPASPGTDAAAADEDEGADAGRPETAAGPPGEPGAGPEPAGRDRTLAAPATRRLATEASVDLDDVPTDETRDGEAFVTPEAVERYVAAREEAASAGAAGEADGETAATAAGGAAGDAGAEAGAVAGADGDLTGERVPYRGVRRTIGEAMVRSKRTIPHVTHHDSADVSDLVALREELKPHAADRGVNLTYTAFVVKAVAVALAEHPYVNAVLDEDAGEIVLRDDYHVGVATETDAGLMVPVVEDVDRKGLLDVARETADLAARARDRSISRSELRGATFTVTNVGVIGGEHATPVVNPPEVAILGLGAIEKRPRVVDDEVVPRHTLPLSLSFDHRVVDGAVAARFTNRVIELLEDPWELVLA